MQPIERTYYRATDAEALFRVIDDPHAEILMGYFANRATSTWTPEATVIGAIGWGDSLVEPIGPGGVKRLLDEWGVASDAYDDI